MVLREAMKSNFKRRFCVINVSKKSNVSRRLNTLVSSGLIQSGKSEKILSFMCSRGKSGKNIFHLNFQ